MNEVPQIWRQPFPEDEIPFILAAIVRCMATVKKKSECELENPITVRLWKKLRRDAELNKRPTHLDPESWELDDEDEDGKIGRVDLRFLFSTGTLKPWPSFAIEAKRLNVTFPSKGKATLVSEYVTSHTRKPVKDEQGMMCFISGRYSRGLRAGAMLGYVFDGKTEAARTAIAATIQEHAEKLKLASGGWIEVSPVIRDAKISESIHDLADQNGPTDPFRGHFKLFHIIVAV